ncbi:hypothetical protein KCU65_g6590, partial [Aureobasidium melanogenum]
MSSNPVSSRTRRRPRPRAIPRATTPAAPLTPEEYEWLWCDDHSKVTKWFLAKSLSYEEFYASFINFANSAWETSQRQNHAPLKGMPMFVVELLMKERIPAGDLLDTLERYSASSWKKGRGSETKGLIKLHAGLNANDLTYGKTKLQQKVAAHLRKTENRLRVANLQAANKATMADQQPLPAFSFGSLPLVGGKKVVKEEDMDVEE